MSFIVPQGLFLVQKQQIGGHSKHTDSHEDNNIRYIKAR